MCRARPDDGLGTCLFVTAATAPMEPPVAFFFAKGVLYPAKGESAEEKALGVGEFAVTSEDEDEDEEDLPALLEGMRTGVIYRA